MKTHSKRIGIIGAGIAGVSSAWTLAQQGHSIHLFDRHDKVALECSYANGGQISTCNSEVWYTWGNVLKGLKGLFDESAPLRINPKPSAAKLQWLMHFMRHTLRGDYEKNTRKLIELTVESRVLCEDLINNQSIDCDRNAQKGVLHFYRSQKAFDEAQKICEKFSDTNWGRTIVNAEKTIEIEPLLESAKVVGGCYTADDFTADIHLFCVHLIQLCKQQYAVDTRLSFAVENIVKQGKEFIVKSEHGEELQFDNIVISTGANTDALLYPLTGKRSRIYPVKGYSLTFFLDEEDSRPRIALLDDEKKIVSASFENRLRVSGTAELNDWNYSIDRKRLLPMTDWVQEFMPHLEKKIKDEAYDSWACLRPMSSDMLPVCEQVADGVFINSGMGHLGWTLGMIQAVHLAQLVQYQ